MVSGADESHASEHFTAVDYALFSLMLAVSVGIGVWTAYRSRGRESTQEYLLGSGAMTPFPVALSLLGGIISAISILGNPTEVYLHGSQLGVTLLGVILGSIVTHQLTLPLFYDLRLVSISQYLELRFRSRAVRLLGTMCQLIVMFIYMGVCLYAPSLALSTVTGLSVLGSIVLMGLVCTFYISVGGVKAVVYTDVMQTLLMFGGVLLVVIICCQEIGLGRVWTIADQGARIEFFNMNTSPFVRHTFWSTTVLGFFFTLEVNGINQPSYQRFASIGNLATAQRLVISFTVGVWLLWGLFYFSGLVAYAAFRDCDPLASGRIQKPDQVIPYLVMQKLGHLTGVPGVFVAAVYGGVLSSLSSNGNSMACLLWEDFLKDIPYFSRMSDAAATRVLKLISVVMGVSGICVGVLAGNLGNIFHVITSISGAVKGPILGVFLAGMSTPWVNTKGAVLGFLVAFCYNVWVVVGKFLRGGGHPAHLPLSVDGCPENLLQPVNASTIAFVSNITTATLSTNLTTDLTADFTTMAPDATRGEGRTVYDVSYCYFGITGILMTLIISNLISFCTGPLSPKAVDRRLSFPSCGRLHQWLWRTRCGSHKAEYYEADHVTTATMLPHTKNHHNGSHP